ncbi:MAG: hypothetical protein ACD_75C01444G0003, partial [uncultured bacterium]
RERAAALARREEKTTVEDGIEMVEFLLAREHYALESAYVREVYPLKDFTPLPSVPAFVLGLLNVRGRIISIIDLKKFFDMPDRGISDLNKVIIVHDRKMEFGILADAIVGVRTVSASDLARPLQTLAGIREEFLKGVTGDRLIVLDGARILADPHLVVHEEVQGK